MIIVLLNAIAIETYKETIKENPSNKQNKNPIPVVNTICPIPVNKEIFPTSFRTFGSKLSPTKKSNKATPIVQILK